MKKSWKFRRINQESIERYDLLKEPLKRLRVLLKDNAENDNKALRLAATDVFVEKAQHHLTFRGAASYLISAMFMAGTVVIACLFVRWVSGAFVLGNTVVDPQTEIRTGPLILMILERLAAAAVFLSGIYLTASFAKAFLHEGTILFSRRHALRFGRLYVYLSDGKITSEELFEAFGWNIAPTTAFSKIHPELVTKGIVGQLGDALEKTAKSTAHLASKTK